MDLLARVPVNLNTFQTRALPSEKSLFPKSRGLANWTTSTSLSSPLPLSNSTLQPAKSIKDLPIVYTTAPDGRLALKAHYPAGSYKLSAEPPAPRGGLSFYASGPKNGSTVDLENAKEATFGYTIFFPEGFDWVKGGKLPGLYGGDTQDVAYSCSGGRRDTQCYSVRLMWREAGAGELYTYLPPINDTAGNQVNQDICSITGSVCDDSFGASIGRGNFTFTTGGWNTVAQRVLLNDAGKANGELELWVDGKSVISVKGLMLRDSDEGRFRGIQVQTFFGGNSSDWATPIDQDVYFSDFSVAVTQNLNGQKSDAVGFMDAGGWNSPRWLFVAGCIVASIISVC